MRSLLRRVWHGDGDPPKQEPGAESASMSLAQMSLAQMSLAQMSLAQMKAGDLTAAIEKLRDDHSIPPAFRLRALAACHLHYRGTSHSIEFPGIEMLRELTRLFPDDWEIQLTLALVWLDAPSSEIDRSDELEQALNRCIELNRTCLRAWYGLGMLEQHRGNKAAAGRAYRTVLDMDPQHVATQYRLHSMGIDFHKSLKPSPIPEFEPKSASAGPFMTNSSGVIARAALPASEVTSIGDALREFFAAQYSERPGASPKFHAAPDELKARLRQLLDEHLLGRVHSMVSRHRVEGWQPMIHDDWNLQMHGKNQPASVPLHSDHPVASRSDDWTTMWFPFTPCGPGIAPSLRVLAVPLSEPLVPADWKTGVMNEVDLEDIDKFFSGLWHSIAMMPGDVLMFGRYIPHATFVDALMASDRMSCDVRYSCGPAAFAPAFAKLS